MSNLVKVPEKTAKKFVNTLLTINYFQSPHPPAILKGGGTIGCTASLEASEKPSRAQ
jgi:hypothetical protein